MTDVIEDLELNDILKKIRYKTRHSRELVRRAEFRYWGVSYTGKLSHIQGRDIAGIGILDITGRKRIPYPEEEGLSVRPHRIRKNTKSEIVNAVDCNHTAAYPESPILMTNNTNMTSYVRAVNDYTVSVHEMFVKEFEINPHTSAIISIKDAPFTEILALRKSIDEFLQTHGLTSLRMGEISFHDDEEELDHYSVYKQSVVLYSDKTRYVGVEILGTAKLLSVTLIGNDQAINDKLTAHIISTKKKYKTAEETRKDKTFYTISSSQRGFELEDLNINTEHAEEIILDNYNDDFAAAHDVVMNSIDSDKKGLILLHGIPGSGKTSYIKHLITGESKRKIVYIPTHLTSAISSPSFISFVKSELSNSVLVIEDAEQVLLSRENSESYKEAVSNILNMTDGILADALNILIICTFNTEMENIDKALLRKGRLLLSYRFGALNKTKTNALCQKLYGKSVDKAMPLSDIYGLEYELITPKEKPSLKMGFVS